MISFKKTLSIDSVKSPISYKDDTLLFLIENTLYQFTNNSQNLLNIVQASKLLEYKSKILILNNRLQILEIYDAQKKQSIPFKDKEIRVESIDENQVRFFKRVEPRIYGFTDLSTVLFETTCSYGNIKKQKGYIFDFDNTYLRLFDSPNSFKWAFNLMDIENDDSFEIEKFLGVAHNCAFILTKHYHLVVLDLENGKLVATIDRNETHLTREAFLHPDNHKIYCLSTNFVKFDTKTLRVISSKKITEEKIDGNHSPILYGIKNTALQGKYISFTSFTGERSGFAKWIGLFDYEKEKIVWHHELLPSEGQLSIPAFEYPKLTGDKLYVLDTENTLHIFKKENKELA